MLRTFYFASLLVFSLLLSCAESKDNKLKAEGEKAYEDLKEFVTKVENMAAADLEDTTLIWENMAGELKEKYYHLEEEVDGYIEIYTPQQRETIQDFKERFRIALNNKQKNFDDARARYRLRQDLLGTEAVSEDLSLINAENITATFQKFVNTVIKNKDVYTPRDWEMIEGWWTALNDRKVKLQEQLRPADEEAIAKKQAEYLELRNTVSASAAEAGHTPS
ncbi:hypothetical protein [Pontibacter beigongshangensis]|uniref:hypothetical protein n=1 Tax=Pontibacter beigongshangensis TaxID=2574733 RepID=UPI00164FCF87|nr:hypothetical protein [Pontibacter beigongshangensis]